MDKEEQLAVELMGVCPTCKQFPAQGKGDCRICKLEDSLRIMFSRHEEMQHRMMITEERLHRLHR